jgi:hypothetical protein
MGTRIAVRVGCRGTIAVGFRFPLFCAALLLSTLGLQPLIERAQAGPADDSVLVSNAEWSPVGASIVLDSPAVSSVLGGLLTIADSSSTARWKYDISKFRLFRWMQDHWLEYADSRCDSFAFVPGRVMWLKTGPSMKNLAILDLGGGDSLMQPDTIRIAPQGWADFCIPYRFNVRLSDIFAATAAAGQDSVENYLFLFKWASVLMSDSTSFQYRSTPCYLPAVPGVDDVDTVLGYGIENGNVFSIYNARLSDTIGLIIPRVAAAGTAKRLLAAQPDAGWTVGVNASTIQGSLSPVYCAYTAGGSGTRFYPSPARWSPVSAGVMDESGNAVYGHALTHTIEGGGHTFEIVFENSQDRDVAVVCNAIPIAGIANGMTVSLIDPATGIVQGAGGSITVSVPAGGRIYRLLAVGSAGYARAVIAGIPQGDFRLLPVRPNPVRGRAVIDYFVPYNSIQSVRCEVIDAQGRAVWTANAGSSLHPGMNELIWNPSGTRRLAPGSYLVRLSGLDGRGNVMARRFSRITRLP